MDELEHIKKLAGVNEFKGYTEYNPHSLESKSTQAAENKKVEEEHNIKPGDPEWFDLWFSSTRGTALNHLPGFRGRK